METTNPVNTTEHKNTSNKEQKPSVYPPGVRFDPKDEELIHHYLERQIRNEPIPYSQIIEVDFYRYNPETLAAIFPPLGENEWYFLTPRYRKYPNGSRPSRSAGNGYWKPTGSDVPVHFEDKTIGYRKALTFYQGKSPKGVKTNWTMQEYTANQPRRNKRSANDMRLDDWVLCRITKKPAKPDSNKKQDEAEKQDKDEKQEEDGDQHIVELPEANNSFDRDLELLLQTDFDTDAGMIKHEVYDWDWFH